MQVACFEARAQEIIQLIIIKLHFQSLSSNSLHFKTMCFLRYKYLECILKVFLPHFLAEITEVMWQSVYALRLQFFLSFSCILSIFFLFFLFSYGAARESRKVGLDTCRRWRLSPSPGTAKGKLSQNSTLPPPTTTHLPWEHPVESLQEVQSFLSLQPSRTSYSLHSP